MALALALVLLLVLAWLPEVDAGVELTDELAEFAEPTELAELAELAECPAEFVEELTAELAEETGTELEDEPEPLESTPPLTLAGAVLPGVFVAAAAYAARVSPDELFAKN